jgi:sugar phosphate isomerase/epimerase
VDRLAAWIALAHLKDRRRDGGVAAAGAGVVDFDGFLSRLHQVGFDGPVVTHGLPADEAPAVAAFLRPKLH